MVTEYLSTLQKKGSAMGAHKTGKGEWQVTYTVDGRQKTVYLGKKYDSRSAAKIDALISEILASRLRKTKLSPAAMQKIKTLPPKIAETFRRHGLMQEPECRTLGELAVEHEKSKIDLKPSSQLFYGVYRQKLLLWFGPR